MIKKYSKMIIMVTIIAVLGMNIPIVKAASLRNEWFTKIDNLIISNITKNSVDVTWSITKDMEYVRLNLIRTGDKVIEKTYITSASNYTIPLTPSTHYYIEVIPYNYDGSVSKSANTIQFNSLGKLTYALQATHIGVCSFNPTTLCVYYKAGINSICTSVELYTVEGYLITKTYGTKYVIFSNLKPGTKYYIKVVGTSSTDIDTSSKNYNTKTITEIDYK